MNREIGKVDKCSKRVEVIAARGIGLCDGGGGERRLRSREQRKEKKGSRSTNQRKGQGGIEMVLCD